MRKLGLIITLIMLMGVIGFAQSVYVSVVAPTYQKKIDSAVAGTTYIGEAELRATDTQSKWRIYRILVTGQQTYIQYMNYSVEFNQKWAERSYGAY